MHKILSINPGATSTKISLYDDLSPIFVESIRHTKEELQNYNNNSDQYRFRAALIEEFLDRNSIDIKELSAVVGRGGPFKPLESGTYRVSEKMMDDVKNNRVQADHISNIGCLLANEIAQKAGGIPAFIVDPVSVDEFIPEARVSGLPEIPRISLAHALNIKMVGKKFSDDHPEFNKGYDEMNLVIAHLGGGISITSHQKGRMIDVNNANDEGPFSPQRVGTLPVTQLAELCYSGKFPQYSDMKKHLIKEGGLHALIGIEDMIEMEKEIANGNKEALFYLNAMGYQIAKYIGAYAVPLAGDIDAIIITGGIAYTKQLMRYIEEKVSWIAPVYVYPGEDEMEALTRGALRVLNNVEKEMEY